jgi:hypothetical protein
MADSAIDLDVIFKSVCYGFFTELLAAIPHGPYAVGTLGTARFVLLNLLRKRAPHRIDAARADLVEALRTLETLEPSDAESALAADLEYAAQRQALPMHSGECQLIAMLFIRDLHHLLTGDRSAIDAMAKLAPPGGIDKGQLAGKFICFEQAVRFMVALHGAVWVRAAVCAERDVDTALRVCFSCASPEVEEASWMEGLDSQIDSLRHATGALLIT